MIHVEDYISGFLLKNKYCAISGLGNLELKRESAARFTDNSGLTPPNYNISFSPVGVIDDAFATYIANHENVSISKASNDIKTFSQAVKAEMQKTGRYEIDGVGHFTYKNETITFFQDETLDLERDPIPLYTGESSEEAAEGANLANAENFKDLDYTHAEKGMSKPRLATLLKYLLGLLLLIGLAAAGYFGFRYYENNIKSSSTGEEAVTVEEYETGESDDTTYNGDEALESGSVASEDGETAAPVTTAEGEFKVAVLSYDNAVSAKVKADKLLTYGNKASTYKKGDRHFVLISAAHSSKDTVLLKDSLRKFFNPSGTPFIVK